MSSLSDQKCFNHALREAVARCTECRNFYCRECITDHEKKLICTSCLEQREIAEQKSTARFSIAKPFFTLVACFVLFLMFYAFGETLLLMPDSFHDGTIWTPDNGWDE